MLRTRSRKSIHSPTGVEPCPSRTPLTGTPEARRPARACEPDAGASVRDEFLTPRVARGLDAADLAHPAGAADEAAERAAGGRRGQRGSPRSRSSAGRSTGFTRLCDDMLQAIRLRAGPLDPERETADLGALVREVIAGLPVELRPPSSTSPSTRRRAASAAGTASRWNASCSTSSRTPSSSARAVADIHRGEGLSRRG